MTDFRRNAIRKTDRWFPGHENYVSSYRHAIRHAGNPDATGFEIELSILRNWDKLMKSPLKRWKRWRENNPQKWEHRLACILAWSPTTEHNPWLERIIKHSELTDPDVGDYQLLNVIGSQNSNKSFAASKLLTQLFIEDPDYTGVYISSPYREATTIGIWGYFKEAFKEVAPLMGWNADTCIKEGSGAIVVNDGDRAGWIRVVSVDKVGMLQGKKPRSSTRGALYLLVEESGAFDKNPGKALWDVLQNLMGQPRFRAMSTCNFKNIFGLDGLLCRPLGKDYADLDVDKDQSWESVRNGFTLRLDGHLSPNHNCGKKKPFPYIVGDDDIKSMIEAGFGPKSPKYMEQIRSFPVTGISHYTVTTMTKLQAGRVFFADRYLPVRSQKWAFADPSLGGDAYRVAIASMKALENHRFVLVPDDYFTVQIEQDRTFTAEDILHADSFNRGHGYVIGDRMTPEIQGALQVAQALRQNNIPQDRYGYDASMRASIQRSMDMFIGPGALAMDYIGGPPDEEMPSGIGNAKDLYSNFNTFCWFLAADMLENGIMREGDPWTEGFNQMCTRLWEDVGQGQRKKMENKEDFKSRNAGKSPDEADCIVGLMYLIYKRSGFFDRGTNHSDGQSVANYILNRAKRLSGAGKMPTNTERKTISRGQHKKRSISRM